MSRFLSIIVLAAVGAAGLAGCGERDQTASYKDGRYRDKPEHGWEKQMRARNDGQNQNWHIGD